MKQFYTFLAAVLLTATTLAQVGINTDSPHEFAALDIVSTSGGLLVPRMTKAERDAINVIDEPVDNPSAGLMIYQTDGTAGFYYYNGSSWEEYYSKNEVDVLIDNLQPTTYNIGDSYGGGIVFFVYDGGQHGLIAATEDQSPGIRWYGGSDTNTRARADGIGAGLKNTAIIIANQGSVDGNAFAATVCNEYSVTAGDVTYGDWYLPSKHELELLYLQKVEATVGGFSDNYYWSSTETDNDNAWFQDFGNGFQYNGNKYRTNNVRAVRAF